MTQRTPRPWMRGIWFALLLLAATLVLALYWTALLNRQSRTIAQTQTALEQLEHLADQVRKYKTNVPAEEFDKLRALQTSTEQRLRLDSLQRYARQLDRMQRDGTPLEVLTLNRDGFFRVLGRYRNYVYREGNKSRSLVEQQVNEIRVFLYLLMGLGLVLAGTIAYSLQRNWVRQRRLERELAISQTAQENAAAELRRRELELQGKQFEAVVDHFPAAVLIYDADLRVRFANRVALTLVGHPWPTIARETAEVLQFPASYVKLLKAARDTGRSSQQEAVWPSRQGLQHLLVLIVPFMDPQGKLERIIAFHSGINERKLLEAALAKANLDLVEMLETLDEGFATVDYNWRYLYVNSTYEKLVGLSREQLLGQRVWDVFQSMPQFNLQLHKAMQDREPLHFTDHFSARGLWVETSAYPAAEGLSMFIRDVTEQVQTNAILNQKTEELRRSETLFRAIMQHFPDGSIVVHDQELRIMFADGDVYRRMGIEVQQYVGKHLSEFVSPEVFNERQRQYSAVFNGQTVSYEFQVEDRVYHGTAVPLPAADGKVERIMVVSLDITHARTAQQALQDNLREKQVLLGEIHHRVKNNLAIVSGLLQLQGQNLSNAEARRVLQQSQSRIHTMAMIHQSLYESDDFARIELDAYVRRLANWLQGLYEQPGLQIETTLDLEPITLDLVQAVPFALILSELITNSFKHAFAGKAQGRISIGIHLETDSLVMDYRDNGNGLPKDLQSGLGMNLVEGLANQLEAQLTYHPGQATWFQLRLHLPRHELAVA